MGHPYHQLSDEGADAGFKTGIAEAIFRALAAGGLRSTASLATTLHCHRTTITNALRTQLDPLGLIEDGRSRGNMRTVRLSTDGRALADLMGLTASARHQPAVVAAVQALDALPPSGLRLGLEAEVWAWVNSVTYADLGQLSRNQLQALADAVRGAQ